MKQKPELFEAEQQQVQEEERFLAEQKRNYLQQYS